VRIDNSTAQLSGHVPSFAALQIALHAAETVPGITAVDDSEIVVTALED
jgi:osmotically-inducible protein OsmY